MNDRERLLLRYLEVWNGVLGLEVLDGLVAADYRGHIGSRARTLARLKQDIATARAAAPDVRFEIVRHFSQGDETAMRLRAVATDPETGAELSARGINMSRWEGELLAEEWAVWEPLERR
jgi:hypothetical protein